MINNKCDRCLNFREDFRDVMQNEEPEQEVEYACESCMSYGPYICERGYRKGYPLLGWLCDQYNKRTS